MALAEHSTDLPYNGASPSAVQYHYDVGTDFYQLWLDTHMIYSAARWSAGETAASGMRLERAQERKLDFHLEAVRAGSGTRLLDIGCGWGGLLRRAVDHFGVGKGIGLTLSQAQYDHIEQRREPAISVYLESYETHPRNQTFDGIVSIGAFEHFARPGLRSDAKVEIYHNFFERCAGWLKPGGRLSLQTITWGDVADDMRAEILPQHVFPESDLPTVDEIFSGAAGVLQVIALENRPEDYVATLEEWLRRLRRKRDFVCGLANGQELFESYEDYLRRSIVGFKKNRINLVRVVFEKTRR